MNATEQKMFVLMQDDKPYWFYLILLELYWDYYPEEMDCLAEGWLADEVSIPEARMMMCFILQFQHMDAEDMEPEGDIDFGGMESCFRN